MNICLSLYDSDRNPLTRNKPIKGTVSTAAQSTSCPNRLKRPDKIKFRKNGQHIGPGEFLSRARVDDNEGACDRRWPTKKNVHKFSFNKTV